MVISNGSTTRGNTSHDTASCLPTADVGVSVVIGCALAVIVGFATHADRIIRLRAGLTGMALFTAIMLVVLGGALLLQRRACHRAAHAGAWAAVAFGFAILVCRAIFGLDVVSVRLDAALGYGIEAAPQVSMATAFCISALGLVILVDAHAVIADLIALIVMLFSGFALLGYAYDVNDLYALPIFKSMALHTAASLLVLAVVSIFVRPHSRWCSVLGARTEAGAATRRQLVFMIIPMLGGAALERAITGGILGPAAALAFLVAGTVASLVILILRDGRRLAEIDAERRANLNMIETLNAGMAERLRLQDMENSRRSAEQTQAQVALFRAQRLEALSRLTASIAHEFNNLLQAIGGSLDLLARRVSDGKPVAPLIERAKTAVRRGSQLGSQLLAFSRTQKLNLRLYALDDLISRSQTMIAAALGARIEVRYDLQAPGQWIVTDPDQFSLALLNVALNARDAMHGPGKFTLKTSLLAPDPAAAAAPTWVSIQLTDPGAGMTAEVLSKATEPFFSTKPEGTASGLGLAQVNSLMHQSEGSLKLRSESGVGTTIELLFPTRSAPAISATDPNPMGGGKTPAPPLILVIEDDEAVRHVIVNGLNDLGYEVAEAPDGAAGIELLKTLRPTAAVIDYLMPLMNGAEVAQRARVDTPNLPIVFVSGHFETAALEDFTNATILRKPFDLQDLQASLSAVLH